jgi:hypothetical protein
MNSFDGAGKPYKSGPSWGTAIVILIVAFVGAIAGWLIIGALLPD